MLPLVIRVCRRVPRLGVSKPHALRHALFDGSQDVLGFGSARVMLRLRVVRHVEASARAVELQQRHRVQEAPRGLERSEALPRLARERGGRESEARDREQRRFDVDGVWLRAKPWRGASIRPL